jgi:type IV secretory pathway TraG/TraD family ATPase VirD4
MSLVNQLLIQFLPIQTSRFLCVGNDPDSAEYFSKVIGTLKATKTTERQTQSFFGVNKSGEMSARDVEEFDVHSPMNLKRGWVFGEAMMIIPHERGAKTIKIKFSKLDDLKPEEIPEQTKWVMPLIEEKEETKKRTN